MSILNLTFVERGLHPFRAAKPLRVLNPSNFVPRNGFPVVTPKSQGGGTTVPGTNNIHHVETLRKVEKAPAARTREKQRDGERKKRNKQLTTTVK